MNILNPNISLICVYNNKKQLDDMFCSSLIKISQLEGVKYLLVNNTCRVYSSCANAYNSELQLHSDELNGILVFVHQDIAFDDSKWIERITEELCNNPNQILGFAGMLKTGKTVSNMRYQKTKELITSTQLSKKTEVESLDECCFAMTKELYMRVRFDEGTCDHWHLYAVDFCYEAKRKLGIKFYVLPEMIYHKYDGTSGLYVDSHFLWGMWKMTRKYCHDFAFIYTPCYITSTSWYIAILKLMRSLLRNIVKTS